MVLSKMSDETVALDERDEYNLKDKHKVKEQT